MKWWHIFKPKWALVPVAVPHIKTHYDYGTSYVTYRVVYIFGFRALYWATNDLK